MSDTFASNLVHFVRYLRAGGLRVVPATTADLAQAAESVGWERRDDIYHAFRSLTVTRHADREVFDDAFELFFGTGRGIDTTVIGISTSEAAEIFTASLPVLASRGGYDIEEGGELPDTLGASNAEILAQKDFGDLRRDEINEIRRLIAQMMWRPAETRGRRRRPSAGGDRPDMRRTFRKLVSLEGELLPLAMSERRPRRRPLIVIADISGSMDRYTEMFLYLIHAAQGRLGRVEAFVFSTRLTRVTRFLRHPDPGHALARIAENVQDWSGGTRIGDALRTFNWEWSRRVTRGGAVAIVISDGWDRGDPAVLEEEIARFSRSVHRLIWLNPRAGRVGFSPETAGLRIALPHVDDFLPAANLRDVRDVIRLLDSVATHRGAAS